MRYEEATKHLNKNVRVIPIQSKYLFTGTLEEVRSESDVVILKNTYGGTTTIVLSLILSIEDK